jgi:cytoskeletal protein CcmA (bactofilin family)
MFKRRIRDQAGGPTTFLAPSTRIVGSLSGSGPFVFCGSVEGDCDIDGPVTLAESGRWQGTLRATDVIVAGTVDGDVVASQRVEISGTARVHGSLSGHTIAIEVGAVIEGDIKVASGAAPVAFREKRDE